LSNELDIVGADVAVLVDDVIVDPFAVEKEDRDLVRTGGSRAVAALTTQCRGFLPLLRLRDPNSGNVRWRVRSRRTLPCVSQPLSSFYIPAA
jgi:hypothetical protein